MLQALLQAWHRVKTLVLRSRLEHDLDDELSFHLAMREAEYVRRGMPADAARTAARRRFGNVTSLKEETREMWLFRSLEILLLDLKFSWRAMRRSPGFALTAILILAVGIGGNTAIFSLVEASRARALPYPEGSRLMMLWGTVMRAQVERRGASYPDYLDWRARTKSFEGLAAFDGQTLTLSGLDDAERVPMEFVSAAYFQLLGRRPGNGRTFLPEEDDVAKPAFVVVLSDGLWRRRFGGDPQIIGQSVSLNGTSHTVVGVMPPGFKGLTDSADLWVPFALYAPPRSMASRGNRGFAVLGRLGPGVSLAAAQAELNGISRQLEREHPETNEARAVEVSPLDVELFGTVRPALIALMAAVAFVLLIACANVATLMIARSEVRRREMAVRAALGAGHGRLLRQLITETCMLTFLAAALGLLLARLGVATLVAYSPVTFPSFVTPQLHSPVAIFTVAVSIACGILVGLAPWLQALSVDLSRALNETARGQTSAKSVRMRSTLVVTELALAVVLVVGAGLMIRTVRNLAALDPGFNPRSLLTLSVSIPRVTPPGRAGTAPGGPDAASPKPVVQSRTLLDRLAAVPGVLKVALGTDLPLGGNSSAVFYAAEGMTSVTAQTRPRAYFHRVSPRFFATLDIPFVAGRTFEESELTPDSPAVIASERLVSRFWPGQDPIGKRLKLGSAESDSPWLTIVGVVREVKYRGLPENPTADPDIYLPFVDRNSQIAIAVRASIPPEGLAAPLRETIRALDPGIPVYAVAPMEDLIAGQTSRSRFTMWLMGVFAAVALTLAVIGIYGVMAYVVSQRTREFGIRFALGADRRDILRLVLGGAMSLVAAGVAIGLVVAFVVRTLLRSLLFGVTGTDAAPVLAVLLLVTAATMACYLAARNAARVDPNLALRGE